MWGFNEYSSADWVAICMGFLTLGGVWYNANKAHQVADDTAQLNDQFNTKLKNLEHTLSYEKELYVNRLATYESLNKLIAEFYVPTLQENSPAGFGMVLMNFDDFDKYRLKVASFLVNVIYLNGTMRNRLYKFYLSMNNLEKLPLHKQNQQVLELASEAQDMQVAILKDIHVLWDLKLWNDGTDHLGRPPKLDDETDADSDSADKETCDPNNGEPILPWFGQKMLKSSNSEDQSKNQAAPHKQGEQPIEDDV